MGVACLLSCPAWTKGGKPVLYDSFSVRRLRVNVLLYPPLAERFPEGVLSRLYAALNTDDMFDDCSLRQRLGAIFEGERITFDIDAHSLRISFRDFGSVQESKEIVHDFLTVTKQILREGGMRFLAFPDEVEMWGIVPDDKPTDAAARLRTKAFKLTVAHLAELPGEVIGVGLEVHGHAPDEDNFTYDITVAPYGHGATKQLYLEAELNFGFPREPPEDDLELVTDAIQKTYDFLNTEVIRFSKAFMP
jgi:hypothetical protein